MKASVLLLAVLVPVVVDAVQLKEAAAARARANPIRKVVTMLQSIQKKIEEEGEKEKQMFDKYMCYCKTSGGDLEKSIDSAGTKLPEVASDIKEGEAKKAQLDEDLVSHKADRQAAKSAVAEATALREKEAAAYATKKASYGADITAMEKAIAALEKGRAGAFLQSHAATLVRSVVQAEETDMFDDDRKQVLAFLAGGQSTDYAPASSEIVGILKQLMETIAKGLSEETATEEAAIAAFEELTSAKKEEISALSASIEAKTVQTGELAVSIVGMKDDLSDTEASMLEDKKFLADLSQNCDTKKSEWDEIVKVRAEEIVAISETIKILNDDEALDLWRKTLPRSASSFVQIKVGISSVRARALSLLHSSKMASPRLDLVALALHSKSAGFGKVIDMIDEMIALLGKEQGDDNSKKAYCGKEFDESDDKKKGLERAVSDAEAAIAEAEGSIATLSSEIEALVEGIKELDKSVVESTEQRKEAHKAFTEFMAQDSAAKELLEFAKNRLNQFYNPKLYVPPPEQELSAEDTIVVNFGGTAPPTPAPGGIAGTGIAVLGQVKTDRDAPPPPPEAVGPYTKKTEESSGVIAMMDLLIKDLVKEMTVAETEEKADQVNYEKLMTDSAAKREADSKLVSEKEGAKAETTAALEAHKEGKASTVTELKSTLETIKALHSECDWLLQYFVVRKEARASEVESLTSAKAVLSGADFSLF